MSISLHLSATPLIPSSSGVGDGAGVGNVVPIGPSMQKSASLKNWLPEQPGTAS